MKDKSLYYISEFEEDYFFHGGIGIIDAERVLQQNGFKQVRLPFHYSFSLWAKLSRSWYAFKTALSIKPGSVLVFIHPLHATLNKWLMKILARRKVKVICMIGDINGLKDGDEQLLREEIKWLSFFRYFIVHNQGMLTWLKRVIPGGTAEILEFFDFLTTPVLRERTNDNTIVFAGNLDKSRFLLQLEQLPLKFHLYGPGINSEMMHQSNVTYHGVVDPYEIPAKLEGSFGLVWDGDSIHGMNGSLGNYMQYVSHHKVSSYILAGLPIIISTSAGTAALIRQYKIGFTINDLSELPEKINKVSPATYQEMVTNTKSIAKKIANGECLSTAVRNLILRLD